MRISEEHFLTEALHMQSPNADARPDSGDISLLVIHCISLPSGNFGGDLVSQLFTNQLPKNLPPEVSDLEGLRVAPHIFIDRSGNVTQFVPFHMRAWHAGKSSWKRRPNCNDYSIGIEVEGSLDQDYETQQYQALQKVITALFEKYPTLSWETIVGHCEIAPNRKVDPGPKFNWLDLIYRLSRDRDIGKLDR
tara:strand:+ start:1695 stop:2270 length:576 start_codon:yes stop_codon:yes gene_type:complete